MASWRCPHCDAPQPETARCWVCHRSTTSCATCAHFRRSVAGNFGYCGLDKGRAPLTGLEERPCWERAPGAERAPAPERGAATPLPDAGDGIWGAALEGPAPPDRPAADLGMWAEPDIDRDAEPDRNQHEGSIRARPWGPVPGHRDSPGGMRGGKWPRQS
jgi:hypothetical protein